MGCVFRWIGLLFMFPLLAAAESGQGTAMLSTLRTSHFEVVGYDLVSAEFASRSCHRLVESTRPWLRLPAGSPATRIGVELRPGHLYRWTEPFRTQIELPGVSVVVRWDADTELENLQRALAQALLLRVAVWHGIADEGLSVPLWLEAALQRSIQAAGNPSYVDSMARTLREQGPISLDALLLTEGDEGFDRRFADNAYWFLRHLEHQGRGSDRTHNFVIRLLRGQEPRSALMATFGPVISGEEQMDLWWRVGAFDRLQRRALTQSHFRDSQQVLRSFYAFSFQREGDEVRLPIDDLWEHRREPLLRAELEYRIQRINLEVRTIHPYHFNAVLSLGQAMVALREGNEAVFREAVDLFRQDYRQAQRLFAETEAALDQLEETLDR